MANIFSKSVENNILKDERFLYPDYAPEVLPFRDGEISEMVFCLKPSAKGQKPTNVFLSGVPGTGKTATSKYVLNELTEFSDRAKPLYINCYKNNSRHGILTKITNFLGYPVPGRGLSSEEIYERFTAVLKTKKFIPILVFDEAEQLLKQNDTKELLYDLSRLNEQLGLFTGLVFISNDNKFLSFLDDRVRSSLNASVLEFEKYTSLQLKEILTQRANFAFFSNVIGAEVIALCAAHASKNGDARLAIDTLLKAARLAEKENSKLVTVTHVRKSFLQDRPVKVEITSNLSKQEIQLLDLIGDKEMLAGEIYLALKENFAERTLRKAIADLEAKKMITTKKVQKGKGFSRLIKKNTD